MKLLLVAVFALLAIQFGVDAGIARQKRQLVAPLGSPLVNANVAATQAKIREAEIEAELRAQQAKLKAEQAVRQAEIQAEIAAAEARANANLAAAKARINVANASIRSNSMVGGLFG